MNEERYNRRDFLKALGAGAALLAPSPISAARRKEDRPNILFCIADDWSWPYASIAGARVIKTPTFDRAASEGVLFENAFVSAPSCTPSRGAILTGQWHWR
ncbi:MAG: sulfatase-like hydrolase/transferase, partial [Sedimentisphaerales bacterium]|nr:sulfatase-like hydrolase/transferase [Sedimentisphaerales bacterium]